MRDISDKEFKEKYLPFFNNINEYLNKYVITDVAAFYLASEYFRNCLSVCPLKHHINSAIDVFNCKYDIDELIPKVKEILRVKYNLKIIKNNHIKLKRYY